jgi:tRNA threonylcarbamoyladenosine biosynthesis protein TsaE
MRPLPQLLHQLLPVEVMTLTHPPILGTRSLQWPDEAACAAFAAALARHPALRDAYVELRGELGAGKTTFARHLLRALGVRGRIKSPTYTVLEPYALPGWSVSHFVFYRFEDAREWEDAGFREVFAAPGLKLAEWPQKAAAMLPLPDLRLLIDMVDDTQRRVTLQAFTPRGVELLS